MEGRTDLGREERGSYDMQIALSCQTPQPFLLENQMNHDTANDLVFYSYNPLPTINNNSKVLKMKFERDVVGFSRFV